MYARCTTTTPPAVRLPCLPLFWRYHLRPELRDLRRSIKPRMLVTLVPLALLLWLAYHLRPELRDLRRSIKPRMLVTLVPLALLLWLA